MSEPHCKDCEHFTQHYVLTHRKLVSIYCGHCTFSRAKRKRPDSKACQHYTPGTRDEEAFASKEYLSKELLQYVLSLELLPEIQDGG